MYDRAWQGNEKKGRNEDTTGTLCFSRFNQHSCRVGEWFVAAMVVCMCVFCVCVCVVSVLMCLCVCVLCVC